MEKNRKIRKIIKSKPTIEGAGVHLKRGFGFAEIPEFDPFLLLDDFRSNEPRYFIKGFPWHPHRGIETITYVLSGDVEHGDSMGNKGVIGSGDMQWMTAGSGIIHQEMPKGDKQGHMSGFQLWANLPASHKMMNPRYRGIAGKEIPIVKPVRGVTVRVICGKVGDINGSVNDIMIEPEYLDVEIDKNSEFVHPTRPGDTVFAYVIDGKGYFCGQKDPFSYKIEEVSYFDMKPDPYVGDGNVVLFDNGEQVTISTEDSPVRFLLVSGKPIREPIAWYGPIVMNTQEELRIAFEEFQSGTFIKSQK